MGDLIDLPGFEVPAMSQNTPGDASQFVSCHRDYYVDWRSGLQRIEPWTERVSFALDPEDSGSGAVHEELQRCLFPRLLIPNSLAFPPVECFRGTSPSQEEDSRALWKRCRVADR